MKRIVVGLSPIDAENRWVGGRYYLHHLVRAVSSLPENERVDFVEVMTIVDLLARFGGVDVDAQPAVARGRSRLPQCVRGDAIK